MAQQVAAPSEAPAPKAGATAPSVRLTEVPEDLDLSLERLSAQGSFLGRLSHGEETIPLDQLHTWTLKLEHPSGEPLSGARVQVDGGMPQHSHGLPTQPLARPAEVPGTYAVEGVRFHMRGWWQLVFVVDLEAGTGAGAEVLTFNLILE